MRLLASPSGRALVAMGDSGYRRRVHQAATRAAQMKAQSLVAAVPERSDDAGDVLVRVVKRQRDAAWDELNGPAHVPAKSAPATRARKASALEPSPVPSPPLSQKASSKSKRPNSAPAKADGVPKAVSPPVRAAAKTGARATSLTAPKVASPPARASTMTAAHAKAPKAASPPLHAATAKPPSAKAPTAASPPARAAATNAADADASTSPPRSRTCECCRSEGLDECLDVNAANANVAHANASKSSPATAKAAVAKASDTASPTLVASPLPPAADTAPQSSPHSSTESSSSSAASATPDPQPSLALVPATVEDPGLTSDTDQMPDLHIATSGDDTDAFATCVVDTDDELLGDLAASVMKRQDLPSDRAKKLDTPVADLDGSLTPERMRRSDHELFGSDVSPVASLSPGCCAQRSDSDVDGGSTSDTEGNSQSKTSHSVGAKVALSKTRKRQQKATLSDAPPPPPAEAKGNCESLCQATIVAIAEHGRCRYGAAALSGPRCD